VLIISQFVISTFLVFATIVIWNQLNFMINTKPGFDQDQQLTLTLNSDEAKNNSSLLINELKRNSNFKSVSGAADALVSGDMNFYPAGKTISDKHNIFLDLADENYLKTLDLQLIAGSNFAPQTFTNTNMQENIEVNDIGHQMILNEAAAKALGFDPYTAPGNTVSRVRDGAVYNYKIVGIVKDYHYFSLHAVIGPMAIMPVNPRRFGAIVAKVQGHQMTAAIKYAEQQWKQLNPNTPFSYKFLNDVFAYDYVQDQRAQQMSGIFTGIAIFISCLGLLGLVTYSVSQKAKEIGIRKVVGASVSDIVMLFSKQYLNLILIANIIAWLLGWYFMNNWLQRFPYRAEIHWWMFAVSLFAGVLVAFCTIAFKTIRAAMANPVNSLRAE
jgi:putative ABC transport system permease protein